MEIPIPEANRLESLIDSAVVSRRGMRWIEDLVASILCANPSKIRKVEAPKITAKKRPEKNRVSVATFLEEMKSAHRMMSSLEPLAALLRAHIRSMPDKLKELGVKPGFKLEMDETNLPATVDSLFQDLLLGLQHEFGVNENERSERAKLLWESGQLLVGIIEILLRTELTYLTTRGLVPIFTNVSYRLSRLLSAWRYMGTMNPE